MTAPQHLICIMRFLVLWEKQFNTAGYKKGRSVGKNKEKEENN